MSEGAYGTSKSSIDDEVNLLDMWRMVWRRWILIGILVGLSVLWASILAINESKYFESTAFLLPTGSWSQSEFDKIPIEESLQAKAMLTSRPMIDELVGHFNLIDHYKVLDIESARSFLKSKTEVKMTHDDVLSITVADQDAKMASDLANHYVSSLERSILDLRLKQRNEKLLRLKNLLMENQKEIAQSESALSAFQRKNKIVNNVYLPIMARMILATAGNHVHEDLKAAQQTISRLRTKPSTLEDTATELSGGDGMAGAMKQEKTKERETLLLPVGSSVELEYGRLLRDLVVKENLHSFLTYQHEEVRMKPNGANSVIRVFEFAVPARSPKEQSMILKILPAGLGSLFVGIVLALFLEYLQRLRDKERATSLSQSIG